ncbi:MAG TPA: hypothetical protein VD913_05505 [bacterium]|nr:hypothetical protein [bacterium]
MKEVRNRIMCLIGMCAIGLCLLAPQVAQGAEDCRKKITRGANNCPDDVNAYAQGLVDCYTTEVVPDALMSLPDKITQHDDLQKELTALKNDCCAKSSSTV